MGELLDTPIKDKKTTEGENESVIKFTLYIIL